MELSEAGLVVLDTIIGGLRDEQGHCQSSAAIKLVVQKTQKVPFYSISFFPRLQIIEVGLLFTCMLYLLRLSFLINGLVQDVESDCRL